MEGGLTMWKDLLDLVRRSLRLAEDTQQTRADVKVLQKEAVCSR